MTIDEFNDKLDQFAKEYPADASDALQKGARKMVRELKAATPIGRTNHKKKLAKSWKIKMKDRYGRAPEANIRNAAPHYHLVERGVQNPKDPHGQPKPEWKASLNKHVGFTERTVQSNWPKVKESMSKTFYKKVRDHFG